MTTDNCKMGTHFVVDFETVQLAVVIHYSENWKTNSINNQRTFRRKKCPSDL